MNARRDVIDYGLQRRARLAQVHAGIVAAAEVCDAHPYLLAAARHYGVAITPACPVCTKLTLTHVHYVYGSALGRVAGQAKTPAELARLAASTSEFDVYVVEVCRECGWNHLVRSFALGTAGAMPPAAEG